MRWAYTGGGAEQRRGTGKLESRRSGRGSPYRESLSAHKLQREMGARRPPKVRESSAGRGVGKSEGRGGAEWRRSVGKSESRRSGRGSPYNHPPSRKALTRCLDRKRDRAEGDRAKSHCPDSSWGGWVALMKFGNLFGGIVNIL